MAEGHGAAIDVQVLLIQFSKSGIKTQLLLAVLLVLPRGEAAQHLRGEGLVDLPVVDAIQLEAVALQDRRGGMHRAEAHLRRIEARPLRSRGCGRWAAGRASSPHLSDARISQAAPSVICELLPGVTLPYLRSKKGLSLARFSTEASLRTPSSSV